MPQARSDITCTYCEGAAPARFREYDLGRSLYICMHAAMRQLTGCSLTIVSTS